MRSFSFTSRALFFTQTKQTAYSRAQQAAPNNNTYGCAYPKGFMLTFARGQGGAVRCGRVERGDIVMAINGARSPAR